jgi:hypothetical protein
MDELGWIEHDRFQTLCALALDASLPAEGFRGAAVVCRWRRTRWLVAFSARAWQRPGSDTSLSSRARSSVLS